MISESPPCYKVGSLMGYNVTWVPMLMDRVLLHQALENRADCGSVGRKSKVVPRICVYFVTMNCLLALLGRKRLSVVNLPLRD